MPAQHCGAPASAATSRRGLSRGASVRSAARSLAERARGLAAISASSGTIGRLVSTRKVGGGRAHPADGASRRRAGCARPETILTMRSSSEWKETTTSRPPGLSTRFGRGEAVRQLGKLLVHENAQRLEGARRRMDRARARRAPRRPRSRPARGWCDRPSAGARPRWRARPRGHGAPRPSVEMMVARSRSDAGATTSAARRPVAAHAHVERAVEAEGEAALGLVELHGRDAEVEHDAVHSVDAGSSRATASQIGEAVLHQGQPAAGRSARAAPRAIASGRGRCR